MEVYNWEMGEIINDAYMYCVTCTRVSYREGGERNFSKMCVCQPVFFCTCKLSKLQLQFILGESVPCIQIDMLHSLALSRVMMFIDYT